MTSPNGQRTIAQLAARIKRLEDGQRRANRTPQLTRSSIDNGAVTVKQDGQVTAIVGQQYDGTSGAVVVAGPTPPVPDGLTLDTVNSGVRGTWRGAFVQTTADVEAGRPTVAPLDFDRVEVEVSDSVDFPGDEAHTRGGLSIPSAAGGYAFSPWQAGTPLYARARTWSKPGKYSDWSPAAGPVPAGLIGVGDLGFDISTLGGTHVYYGTDDPSSDPSNTVALGDLWLKETDPGPPPKYEINRWTVVSGVDAWQPLADQGVADAAATAIAAQQAADAKAQFFVQDTEPTWSGAANTAIWVDTAHDNARNTWDGTQFVLSQLGNGAITPNSLVASDVLATGTVTAALFEALLVLATAIILGDQAGTHVRVDPDGITSYVLNPDGQVVPGSTFGPQGADSLLSVDPATGKVLASIDGSTGHASFTGLDVDGDPVFQGNTLTYLLDQRPRGELVRAGVEAPTPTTTTALGVYDVEFLAEPGRSYRIHTSTLNLNPSTTSTYGYASLVCRPSADGPPGVSLGKTLVAFRGSTNIAGGIVPGTLDRTCSFDELFSGTPPTVPTKVRVLLTYGVISGGGNVGLFGDPAYPIHTYVEDVGVEKPFTGVANLGGGTSGTAVTTQQLDFAQTWGSNWQSTSTAPRTDQTDLIQGYTSYYPGPGSEVGMIGFPDLTATLAGATINWMALFLYANWWNNDAGGTVLLGAHPYLNSPASRPADWQLNQAQVGYSGKSGYQWIYIPSTWFAGFISGANRGFTLGDLASTAGQYYGRFYSYPSNSRPVLRINFTK